MKRFTELFQAIDATTSTNAKVAAIRQYFVEEAPANAVWALYLLLSKTRRRLVTSRVLRDVYLSISEIPEWLFQDCYAHVGDSAEVIACCCAIRRFRVSLLPTFLCMSGWSRSFL